MAPRFTDYYEILGVSFDATTKQITSQYRKLARMYHPDVNSEQNAEAKFKIIAEAYEILSHPPSREDFDTHYEDFHKIPRTRRVPDGIFIVRPPTARRGYMVSSARFSATAAVLFLLCGQFTEASSFISNAALRSEQIGSEPIGLSKDQFQDRISGNYVVCGRDPYSCLYARPHAPLVGARGVLECTTGGSVHYSPSCAERSARVDQYRQ